MTTTYKQENGGPHSALSFLYRCFDRWWGQSNSMCLWQQIAKNARLWHPFPNYWLREKLIIYNHHEPQTL
jgi:hypothetical protein